MTFSLRRAGHCLKATYLEASIARGANADTYSALRLSTCELFAAVTFRRYYQMTSSRRSDTHHPEVTLPRKGLLQP
jgi:hypothetical protein